MDDASDLRRVAISSTQFVDKPSISNIIGQF